MKKFVTTAIMAFLVIGPIWGQGQEVELPPPAPGGAVELAGGMSSGEEEHGESGGANTAEPSDLSAEPDTPADVGRGRKKPPARDRISSSEDEDPSPEPSPTPRPRQKRTGGGNDTETPDEKSEGDKEEEKASQDKKRAKKEDTNATGVLILLIVGSGAAYFFTRGK